MAGAGGAGAPEESNRCSVCGDVRKDGRLPRACFAGCGKATHPTCLQDAGIPLLRGLCTQCCQQRKKSGDKPTMAVMMHQLMLLTELVVTLQERQAETQEKLERLMERVGSGAPPATVVPWTGFTSRDRSSSNVSAASARKQTPYRETLPQRKRSAYEALGSQPKSQRITGEHEERGPRPAARPPATRCTGEDTIPIAAAAPAQYPDRVMVSRVALGTPTEAILSYAATLSKHVTAVVKMKTRVEHPSFSSFVVEVQAGDGQLICDPTKWRAGITVKTFHGRIRDDQEEERVLWRATEELMSTEDPASKEGDDGNSD